MASGSSAYVSNLQALQAQIQGAGFKNPFAGLSMASVAGAESGGNPLAVNPGSGAVGYFQWLSPDRVTGLGQAFASTGTTIENGATQGAYAIQEINSGAYPSVMAVLNDPSASLAQTQATIIQAYEAPGGTVSDPSTPAGGDFVRANQFVNLLQNAPSTGDLTDGAIAPNTNGDSGNNSAYNWNSFPNAEGTYSGQTQTEQDIAQNGYELPYASTSWDDMLNAGTVHAANTDYSLGYGATPTSDIQPGPQSPYGDLSSVTDPNNTSGNTMQGASDPGQFNFAWPSSWSGGDDAIGGSGASSPAPGGDDAIGGSSASSPAPGGSGGSITFQPDPGQPSAPSASGNPSPWNLFGVPATLTAAQTAANATANAANLGASTAINNSQSWIQNVADWFIRALIFVVGIALVILAFVWMMRDGQTRIAAA